MSSGNETDLFRKAAHEQRDLQELQREAAAAQPRQLGVETSWQDGLSGAAVSRGQSELVAPSRRELEIYSDGRVRTCGSCKYFDLERGRKKIIDERFAERLVHDENWQLRHLCAPVDMIGLCGQSAGELAVTIISRACDGYREHETKAGRWRLGKG